MISDLVIINAYDSLIQNRLDLIHPSLQVPVEPDLIEVEALKKKIGSSNFFGISVDFRNKPTNQ